MASYREQLASRDRLAELADLEDTYLKAQETYRKSKKSPADRDKFQKAKSDFAEGQRSYREEEEAAGRREPGVSVGGDK
jgi:hypothetical protein